LDKIAFTPWVNTNSSVASIGDILSLSWRTVKYVTDLLGA